MQLSAKYGDEIDVILANLKLILEKLPAITNTAGNPSDKLQKNDEILKRVYLSGGQPAFLIVSPD